MALPRSVQRVEMGGEGEKRRWKPAEKVIASQVRYGPGNLQPNPHAWSMLCGWVLDAAKILSSSL